MTPQTIRNRPIYTSLTGSPPATPSPKASLLPPCAVFPENMPIQTLSPPLPPPVPPPPLAPSMLSPNSNENTTPTTNSTTYFTSPSASPSPKGDQYDYFEWTTLPAVNSNECLDISTTAPVGSLQDDPRIDAKDAAVGAWYAFKKGIHTPIGLKQFSDQTEYLNSNSKRRPRNTAHHRHTKYSCSQPCPQCSLCHATRPLHHPSLDSKTRSSTSTLPPSSLAISNSPFASSSSSFKRQHRHQRHRYDHFERFYHHQQGFGNDIDENQLDGDEEDEDDFEYDDDDNDDEDQSYKQHQISCNHEEWSGPLITCFVDSFPQTSGTNINSRNQSSSIQNTTANNNMNITTTPATIPPQNQEPGGTVHINPAAAAATADILSENQTEITAEQVAEGMDVQGIPWETLPFTRADYRDTRLTDQTRSRDTPDFAPEGPNYHLRDPRRSAQYYDFFSNARNVKCSIVHFQLRNLAWATSKHDVFVMHDASVVHWNAASKTKTQVLDLSGSDLSMLSGLGTVQISTMIAKDNLVIAGGFYGEMVAKNMNNGCIIHNKRITYDDNAITNAIDIFDNTIMTSNNDKYVRCFDIETFTKTNAFRFETPVNHATRQPNGKMVIVAGDEHVVQVIDGDTGENVSHLHGHAHFSFATGWHPNGNMFATGSQDRTCRIWDIRNMSQHVNVLGAHMGAVRSLRFSSCGKFMMMAEPRDYVHVFDVNRGLFDSCQEIDLFGEIAGIAMTPEAEGLFVAVSDRLYSSLLEYERRGASSLTDLFYE